MSFCVGSWSIIYSYKSPYIFECHCFRSLRQKFFYKITLKYHIILRLHYSLHRGHNIPHVLDTLHCDLMKLTLDYLLHSERWPQNLLFPERRVAISLIPYVQNLKGDYLFYLSLYLILNWLQIDSKITPYIVTGKDIISRYTSIFLNS